MIHNQKDFVATPSTQSQPQTLSRHESSIATRGRESLSRAHAALLHKPWLGRAPRRQALSQHGSPCCDTGPKGPCYFWPCVATKDSKWAVAHSSLLHFRFPLFFSFSFPFQSTLNSKYLSLFITKTTGSPEKLPKYMNYTKRV